ncbi:hypothetical protein BKA80DRAFT_33165 [Phyllosticta citrichinensis]
MRLQKCRQHTGKQMQRDVGVVGRRGARGQASQQHPEALPGRLLWRHVKAAGALCALGHGNDEQARGQAPDLGRRLVRSIQLRPRSVRRSSMCEGVASESLSHRSRQVFTSQERAGGGRARRHGGVPRAPGTAGHPRAPPFRGTGQESSVSGRS